MYICRVNRRKKYRLIQSIFILIMAVCFGSFSRAEIKANAFTNISTGEQQILEQEHNFVPAFAEHVPYIQLSNISLLYKLPVGKKLKQLHRLILIDEGRFLRFGRILFQSGFILPSIQSIREFYVFHAFW